MPPQRNLMASGLSMLRRALPLAAGVPITYSRAGESVMLTAVEGRTAFEITDSAGQMISTDSRDFIIEAIALVLGGSLAIPQRGDKITKEDGRVFEVLAIGGGQPYAEIGTNGDMLRVHTKRIT